MKTIDERTRRRRALVAWIAVTVLLLGAFIVVRVRASGGLDDQVDAAQERAVTHAAVVSGMVEAQPDEPNVVFNHRELTTRVQAEVFDDPTVARLRVYGVDGVILFATDQSVRAAGIQAPSDDPGVTSALEGVPYRSIADADFTWSTVGTPGTPAELLQTFEALRLGDRFAPAGVVQVDFFMEDLRAAAVGETDRTLTVIAVLALLSLAAAVFTFRRLSAMSAPAAEGAEPDELPDDPAEAVEVLRTRLRNADGRRAKAERSLERVTVELEGAKQAGTAAEARVADLEAQVAAAAVAATATSAVRDEPDGASNEELEGLRRQLDEARSRAEAAEAATSQARAESEAAQSEVAAIRAEVEKAQGEVEAARREADEAKAGREAEAAAVAAARAEAEAARAEAAKAEAARAQAEAAKAEATATADGDAALHEDVLQRLEARIAAAEQRAKDAEERIDRIAPLSDEASDLRARLAKTAARKKLGPSGSED